MTTIASKRTELAKIRANGHPKGQPRPRAFVRAGRAAVYDPGTAEGWKAAVAVACEPLAGDRIEAPLALRLTFFMPRPRGHYLRNGMLKTSAPSFHHAQKPDADNLAKAVMDAMTQLGVWFDDSQIAELAVSKYWDGPENPAGCVITITALEEEVMS
jgi:Holliday junction resolvase RusA-like endonuclease